MKKIISLVLSIIVMLTCFSLNTSASHLTPITPFENEIVYLDDGSYIITEYIIESVSTLSSTITRTKRNTYCTAEGEKIADLSIKATFKIGKETVYCSEKSASTNVYMENWFFDTPETKSTDYLSYSVVTATALLKKKTLGITTKKVDLSVSIRCNLDGTIT